MARIKIKNSQVKDKAPLPADLVAGEIAVNTHADSPAIYLKDTAGAIVKIAGAGAIGGTPATETAAGIVELATAAEVTTGTDTTRAVTPAGLKVELDKKAPLASPALTGTPTAPTAAAGTNTTQIATTAFVTAAVAVEDLWDRTGTVVSPSNDGDSLELTSGGAAGVSLDPGTTTAPFVRTSQGRIGIGIPNPTTPLHVNGAIYCQSGGVTAGVAFSTRPEFGSVSSHDVGFMTNSTTRMTLTTSGQLKLGTSGNEAVSLDPGTPASPLVRDSLGRVLVGTSTARTNVFGGAALGGLHQIETAGAGGGNAQLGLFGGGSGTTYSGPVIVMGAHKSATVGGNGLVADGDRIGLLTFQGNNGAAFFETARFSAEIDGVAAAGSMPGRLIFSTTPAGTTSTVDRMKIASTGETHIFSAASTLNVTNSQPAGTGSYLYTGVHSRTNISTGGTLAYAVYTNGDVGNTNNSYGPLASDQRLKQDITDASSQWDDIKNIRITNFHYKSDPAGPLQLGPIAQELELVSPGLITRRPASEDEIADSSNGLVDGDEVLSFKASVLYMKAVKALQEAMERIETLEAKVAALTPNP